MVSGRAEAGGKGAVVSGREGAGRSCSHCPGTGATLSGEMQAAGAGASADPRVSAGLGPPGERAPAGDQGTRGQGKAEAGLGLGLHWVKKLLWAEVGGGWTGAGGVWRPGWG